jgi:hypothetical protein
MTASFRKIDYSLRPAKHAERRMLCEVFRKLTPFQPVEDYLYVGMGSLWFSDFILFHRLLGIRDMISIDKSGARERLEANKPFRSIVLDDRPTTKALPTLDWKRRQFVWLDYDDQIDLDKLLDMRTVATRAQSGTVLAVSVQCESAKERDEAGDGDESSAAERFRDRFGRERISPDLWDDDLVSWRFGTVSREMLQSEIKSSLATRNSGIPADEVVSFQLICEIEYSDGAKMTTLVGAFVAQKDTACFDTCGFAALDFLPSKGRLVRVDVPKLTVREIRRLEQLLPKNPDGWEHDGIPAKDAKLFAALYRYLPNFAVLEF